MKASVIRTSSIPTLCRAVVLSLSLLVPAAYGESRISGTYISHGANFAEMLQVTQTDNGQLTGALSSAELKPSGSVDSTQGSIKGAVDGGQVTITVRSELLSFLGGTNLSGTVKGNEIQLQFINSNGGVAEDTFVRGTPADFIVYVSQLKLQGARIVLNRNLDDGAQHFRKTVQAAEEWITNAELHVQRIPKVESRYQQIEDKMQSLVAQERAKSSDLNARLQIANVVDQGDIAGRQVDIGIDNLWDINIADVGNSLENEFAKWDGNCGTPAELQKRGATMQAADAWESACKQALVERAKFEPIYKQIMEQRVELKTFQARSQKHRKVLVEGANQMNYAQER